MKRNDTRLLALSLLAAGCHGYVAHGPAVLQEVEPNDHVAFANYVGLLHVNEAVRIRGHVQDNGFDPYDGFAFEIAGPCTIDVFLDADLHGVDLDVLAIEPHTGIELARFQSPYDPEGGSLALNWPLGGEFHLVVSSFFGSSSYSLDVSARPFSYSVSANADPIAPIEARRAELFDGYLNDVADEESEEEATRALWIERDDEGRIVRIREARISKDDIEVL